MSFFRRKKDKKTGVPPDIVIKSSDGTKTQVKRTPSQRSRNSPRTQDVINGDIGFGNDPLGKPVRPTKLLLEEDAGPYDPGDLGNQRGGLDSPMRTASRLSKTFNEVLRDKDALSCFIQFMEARKAGHLIHFWLDAESFQASTWSRIRSHSLNEAKKSKQALKIHSSTKAAKSNTANEDIKVETGSIDSSQTLTEENDCQNQVLSQANENSVTSEDSGSREITDSGTTANCQNLPTHASKYSAVISTNSVLTESTDVPSSAVSVTDGSLGSKHLDFSDQQNVRLETRESPVSDDGAQSDSVSDKNSEHSRGKLKSVSSQEDLAEKLKRSIERDAVSIFQKYLSQDAPQPIGITDQLRNECIRKICREDGEVDPTCFHDCQNFIIDKMNKEYHQEFSCSEFHNKHQVNVLTTSKVYLADILYNEGGLFYLTEFMEREDGMELLQFWVAADNFQQHLISMEGEFDGMQAQADAMILYDKYFSLQATSPLGFDDKIRFQVEGNICQEEGPKPDCFAKPRDIVLRTMEKIYFPSFLQSDIYYKYLSELVSTVQIASDLPKPKTKHKRQDSDASSVHSAQSAGSESVSMKNTLLAMDSSHLRKKLNESEMQIDPKLLNPDLLWKRSSPGMSLGKVDEMGRFVSEFDPQPDVDKSKGGSRLFKKKKEKDKEQEEMALQIAQMIINDVTTVTQTIGAMKNPEASESSQES